MLFSYRKGIKKKRIDYQDENLDDKTKNLIWNELYYHFWSKIKTRYNPPFGYTNNFISVRDNSPFVELINNLWTIYFHKAVDDFEDHWSNFYNFLRDYYYSSPWYEVYDFIEFIISNYGNHITINLFTKKCNIIFKEELVPYRFIKNIITDITSDEEISEIEEAISQPFKSVNEHISTALNILFDKKNPDYRNSIKESISAVEALCKIISKNDKATLSEAIKIIDKENKIHPSFKIALDKLYGYTSDEKGIRHSLLESNANINFEDAKFMLVSCSAFINYIKEKIS